jgi:biopolymer transport protein ExbD
MKINFDSIADDAQIQIIPLIDVIFCILTFFVLAALQLTRQQGINIDLPKANTGTVQMREMIVVSIDAAGQIYIDKNLINRAQLYDTLKEYRDRTPEGLLVLNASQNAFYNDVIQVLDVLRSVGGERVALATIPPTNTTSPSPMPSPGASPGLFPSDQAVPGLFPLPMSPGSNGALNPINPVAPATPGAPMEGSNPASPGAAPMKQPFESGEKGGNSASPAPTLSP